MLVNFDIKTKTDARALEAFLAIRFPAGEVKNQRKEAPVKEEAPVKKVTLEMIRGALAKKVKLNKDAIKAQLAVWDAPNLTLLDKKYYTDMYNFLENLKNTF